MNTLTTKAWAAKHGCSVRQAQRVAAKLARKGAGVKLQRVPGRKSQWVFETEAAAGGPGGAARAAELVKALQDAGVRWKIRVGGMSVRGAV